ncbi:MAG: sensor histidine kinase KdpD [Candidatus Sericytochromatia bacterium]
MNFDEERPNPDLILQEIKNNDENSKKGKLKIFFGMCAGVGKTYAMLKMAHDLQKKGADIIIGYIETHGRKETQALITDLELIPRKKIEYKGVFIEEMDIDAILNRKPQIVLVDELAHSNANGSRHNKRYQDVFELLDNGINVFTTLNVQHLESRTDTVSKITGIIIHETVPDSVLDRADEIEIIDLSPEDLLKRLSEGKIYKLEKSESAIQNFFRKGNLTALREMALRLTAERVDQDLRDYKQIKKIAGTWKSGNRLMVAISSSPYSAQLIRGARRISYTLEAKWIAVYVDTGKNLSEKNQLQLTKNIKLAQKLGAEIIITSGNELVETLLNVANQENITQIVLGKSGTTMGSKNIINRLIAESGDIDIYVVGGEYNKNIKKKNFFEIKNESNLEKYLKVTLIVFFTAILGSFIEGFVGYQVISFILLLVICFLPLFFNFGPVLLAATLSALLWDFLFIPPKYTFYIGKIEDLLMFIMFFSISIITGFLTSKIRKQEKFVIQRELKTQALYKLTKDLTKTTNLKEIMEISVKNLKAFFDIDCIIFPLENNGNLSKNSISNNFITIDDKEYSVANWVLKNKQKAGKYTTTLPSSSAQYYPIFTNRMDIGVLGVKNKDDLPFNNEQEILLEAFIYQIASAMERELLNEKAKEFLILSESERLYKTLFNSISHELRTPITTIMGASSLLIEEENNIPENYKIELGKEIYTASERLNILVGNLLDMSRLESGTIKLNLDWQDINDLISKIIKDFKNKLNNHKVKLELYENLSLIKIDFILLEQSFINIINNAINYTPIGSEIFIKTTYDNNFIIITIADNGKGIPDSDLNKIFDKFYRVNNSKTGGTGLGLSIAKGFITAHKGTIIAENRETGGLRFMIKLPL